MESINGRNRDRIILMFWILLASSFTMVVTVDNSTTITTPDPTTAATKTTTTTEATTYSSQNNASTTTVQNSANTSTTAAPTTTPKPPNNTAQAPTSTMSPTMASTTHTPSLENTTSAVPANTSSTSQPTTTNSSIATNKVTQTPPLTSTSSTTTNTSETTPSPTTITTDTASSDNDTDSTKTTTTSTSTTTTTAATTTTTTTTTTTAAGPCNPSPCVNGTCAINGSDYICTCNAGYTNKNCSQDINECNTTSPCDGNADCKNTAGSFMCTCHHGFTGDGKTCTDTDDCLSKPCNANANCTNTPGSYTCTCKSGYTGTGNTCTDINECTDGTSPCDPNAKCNNTNGSYTCTCNSGFTGNGTVCQDVDECKTMSPCSANATCTNTNGGYTCMCKVGFTGNGTVCTDINDCVNVTCEHGGTCKDHVNNYTCSCEKGWEGAHCENDIDECVRKTHECHSKANCTNTEGDYNCTCNAGYEGDGKQCSDINECGDNTDQCSNNTDFCHNRNGGYICICKDGWNGTYCDVDIDECATSPCSVNATCTNTQGFFTCKCNDGFRGDGETCIREVLFNVPGGSPYTGDDNTIGPFRVPGGLPYLKTMYYDIYVNMNGYLSLGKGYSSRYPPKSAATWSPADIPIIAPLWADIVTKNKSMLTINSNINTTIMEEMVSKSQQTLNNPRFGFAATWKNAVPYPYEQNANSQMADFQAVILTNGSQTLAIFNYDNEVFTWDPAAIGRYVSIGYTDSNQHGAVKFNESNFTKANKDSNIGIDGRWVFIVSDNDATLDTEVGCQNWLNDVTIQKKLMAARAQSQVCPCSLAQAFRDGRFRYRGYLDSNYVFHARFSRGPYATRQKCHYDSTWGGQVIGYPGGGYLDSSSNDLMIEQAYMECCKSSVRLCGMFYEKNPSNNCHTYWPLTWWPSWGDPHITTLDGKEYTFNGRGEYLLMKAQNTTTVQVRTDLFDNSTDATVFVGLAAQESGGDTVEIILNRTMRTCSIYLNGEENSTFPSTGTFKDIDASKVSVYEAKNTTDKSLVVAFESGISIQIAVSDILGFVSSVPQSIADKVSGLLGNFDGDSTNDFIVRNNGTVLSADSTEEKLFEFGSSWMIFSNESLFNYSLSDGNYSFYNNDDIRPVHFVGDYLNNLTAYLASRCPSGSLTESDVMEKCDNNTACIIDAAATCDVGFGQRSKDTQESVEMKKMIVDNNPPKFYNNNTLMTDSSTVLRLLVNDTNSFSVRVETNIIQSSFTFDESTKVFTWNITEDLKTNDVKLKFVATDDLNGTSTYEPTIYYCGCSKASECDYTMIEELDSNPNKFYRARCNCAESTTGKYCTETIDPCDPNPCFPGSVCDVKNAPSPCGMCPEGYSGTDGMRCYDVDECLAGTHACQQHCTNILGSYICSCDSGYTLNTDGHHCDDIDECADVATNICTDKQYCRNLNGSFTCGCLPGYVEVSKICQKVKRSFVISLTIDVTQSPNDEAIKNAVRQWLTNDVFHTNFTSIDVILKLKHRTRRETAPGVYEVEAVLHSDNESLTTDNLKTAFDTYINDEAVGGKISPPLSQGVVVEISSDLSNMYDESNSPLCNIGGYSRCDPLSTNCKVDNARTVCECKAGFKGWRVPQESCNDVDECSSSPSVCNDGNCTNLLGDYTCHCKPGYQYDGSQTCLDLCQTNPCQNGGSCIHGAQEAQYICKCDDKWAGANCEQENDEAKRLKTIAIVVGSVIGGVCLLLLLALFGVYRRYSAKRSGYGRYTYRSSIDNEYSIPRARVNRDKDMPFDDQNTTFSIPRPKVTRGDHEMTDLDAQSDISDREQYAKGDKEDDAKQPLASSSQSIMTGKENPSFLHDESNSNLRKSKSDPKRRNNPYEYF